MEKAGHACGIRWNLRGAGSWCQRGRCADDEALFAHLRNVRRTLADGRNVPAYVIFFDVALREMARMYPATPAEFRRVPGVGEQKLKDFAEPFLAVISEYVREHGRQVHFETARSAAIY